MNQKTILYFRKELERLKASREELVHQYPKLAPFLALDSQDPDTEKLIDNFAILTAKIRQEIDENVPFLAESLLNILSPNFTTPIPSICLQSFEMEEGDDAPYAFLPKGTQVFAKQGEKQCQFKTLYDVHLYPLRIVDVTLQNSGNSQVLSLLIASKNPSLMISDLKLSTLHFFLGNDIHTSTTLLMWIFSYLDAIVLQSPTTQQEYKIPISSIFQLGLKEQEGMFFGRNKGIEAFGLLQEFLILPDKFNFFGLTDLGVAEHLDESSFILKFIFSYPLPSICMPKVHHFQLGVSPIVNTFMMSAEPITNDGKKDAYRIFIDRHHPENYEILEIIKVAAHNVHSGRRVLKNYKNFERFDFFEKNGDMKDFYNLQTRYGHNQISYKEISFFNHGEEFVGPETVSIDAYVCNADIPKSLQLSQISEIQDFSFIKTGNITIPTPMQRCEVDGDLMWKLVGFLTINIEGIMNKKSFLALLQVYNFYATDQLKIKAQTLDVQKIANRLIDVKSQITYRITNGASRRGVLCIMQFNLEDFYCVGEIYRLGLMFSHFLNYFAPLNSFCELQIECFEKELLKYQIEYDSYNRN